MLAVLNQVLFAVTSHWHAGITVGLVLLAYLGIPAVTGDAFQKVMAKAIPVKFLHLIHPVLAALVAAGTLALTLNAWGQAAHAIIAAVVTILVGLGFGPTVSAAVGLFRRRPASA